jgi:thiol:disulfide interchange protein
LVWLVRAGQPFAEDPMSALPALRRACTWLVLFCGVALGALAVAAPGPEAATEQVRARLLAQDASVQPGRPLVLGLQQRIVPHWHTYWRNPGDSGLATTIAWALPAGATAGAIDWPAPRRFQLGPVTNYGYADEVTLLSTVQVPAGLRAGETFKVEATVDWLVCDETCIPQQVVLALQLPVKAEVPVPSADAALIEAARARLPQPGPWAAQWRPQGHGLRLRLQADQPWAAPREVFFYAATWGQVAHGAAQSWTQHGPDAQLQLVAGDAPPAAGTALEGVLVLVDAAGVQRAYAVRAAAEPAAAPVAQAPANPAAPAADFGGALLLAFVGGLILNLMPCVFPVLSIKALSLLGHADTSRRLVRWQGVAYTAGVLASFVALAGGLLVLKAGGASVGWGFQFQSPLFVAGLALLMTAVGLNLSGVYTLGASLTGVGGALAQREGLAGSFFTGVLATVVATPCTAPFMGAALGYALTQPAPLTLAIFVSLGLGLAAPYLLLSWWPALQRWLPRPGVWMERLKQALAFPMYAAAAWLVWVLSLQAGPDAVAVVLGGAVLLGLGAWLIGSTQVGPVRTRRWGTALGLIALIAAASGTWYCLPGETAPAASRGIAAGAWEPYSPERLQALHSEGRPVFVNLTAAWCITCLVNERVALSRPEVEAVFRQAGIARLKGDWTQRDERITRLLAEHGRSGVPLYLYYPAAAPQPVVLPQLLTPDLVIAALAAAR